MIGVYCGDFFFEIFGCLDFIWDGGCYEDLIVDDDWWWLVLFFNFCLLSDICGFVLFVGLGVRFNIGFVNGILELGLILFFSVM